jgi:cation diffusion facilitator family transporter
MTTARAREFPADKEKKYASAVRLEWVTIGFFIIAITLLYLTLGSSQAMKAAWVEDILALIPPIAFLIAARVRTRNPNKEYPYGYHRAVSVAYMAASLALLLLGLVIFYDSVAKLVTFEHPPIGLVQPFGEPIWLGWLMIAALAFTIGPALVLGRMKVKLAREIQDKVLFADGEMNKADWMTAAAAILGIVGIRFGLWWADAVAAIFISVDIVHDGWRNVRAATGSLMDKRPQLVDGSAVDPLPARVETEMKKLDWVADVRVRIREEGHLFIGDITVVPKDERNLLSRIESAKDELLGIDWRLYDITISPVRELEGETV